MFVMGQLWKGSSDEYIINLVEDVVSHCAACEFSQLLCLKTYRLMDPGDDIRPQDKGEAPISILRPVFLHLQNAETLARLHPRVLSVLQRNDHPDDSASIVLSPWTEGLTPQLRSQFRDHLRVHLFGWDSLLAQRLQISLAAFCLVCHMGRAPDPMLTAIQCYAETMRGSCEARRFPARVRGNHDFFATTSPADYHQTYSGSSGCLEP